MKDFKLEDGDIQIEHSDISYITEEEELAQSIRSILGINIKEFLMEPSVGLDRENMIGKNFNADYLKQDISRAIKDQEPRIVSVDEIVFREKNRYLNVQIRMSGINNEKMEVAVNVE